MDKWRSQNSTQQAQNRDISEHTGETLTNGERDDERTKKVQNRFNNRPQENESCKDVELIQTILNEINNYDYMKRKRLIKIGHNVITYIMRYNITQINILVCTADLSQITEIAKGVTTGHMQKKGCIRNIN